MFCKNCGKESEAEEKFCTRCGTPFSGVKKEEKKTLNIKQPPAVLHSKSSWSARRIITILVVLVIAGVSIYNSLDEDSITKNNEGMASFNSGDSKTAISQLQQAKQDAVTNENKINSLKNLGYVYVTEGQNEQALNTFKETLALTKKDTYDYYLMSGEIALLEDKQNSALLNFNKAYEIEPKGFQVNNSLAIFYLDMEEKAAQYRDYQKALFYAKNAYEYDAVKSETAKQNLAVAHYYNDNFDQTISLLSTTNLAQHPYIALWLGLAYAAKKDISNAKFYFQKAVDAKVEIPQEVNDYLNTQ